MTSMTIMTIITITTITVEAVVGQPQPGDIFRSFVSMMHQ